MRIQICGMDPSLRNWGLAIADLDLETGVLDTPVLHIVQTEPEPKNKQVRVNSLDLSAAETLYKGVTEIIKDSKVIFVEVPHGSQSAASMKGYGICIGVLAAIRASGKPMVEVSESESKIVFTGKRTATKDEMIKKALEHYPKSNWPMHGSKISSAKAEHMADAIASIHAGVRTEMFKGLLNIFKTI